jgi:hypothetical protein
VQSDGWFTAALIERVSNIESDRADWREILKADTGACPDISEVEVLVP